MFTFLTCFISSLNFLPFCSFSFSCYLLSDLEVLIIVIVVISGNYHLHIWDLAHDYKAPTNNHNLQPYSISARATLLSFLLNKYMLLPRPGLITDFYIKCSSIHVIYSSFAGIISGYYLIQPNFCAYSICWLN